jgi:CRP-like cAMP-binding protein/HAMP domain-containing protein
MASIRQVIPIVLSVQLTIAVGLTGLFSFWNGQKAVYKLAGQAVATTSERIEQHIDTYLAIPSFIGELLLSDLKARAIELNNQTELRRYLWNEIPEFLNRTYIYYGNEGGDFIGIDRRNRQEALLKIKPPNSTRALTYRLDSQGKEIPPPQASEVYDPRQRPWYQLAKETKVARWSSIYISADGKRLNITFAVPVFSSGGGDRPSSSLSGVLGVDVTLGELTEFLRTQTRGRPLKAFIVSRSGQLVATSTEEEPFLVQDGKSDGITLTSTSDPLLRTIASTLQNQGGLDKIQEGDSSNFSVQVDGKPFLVNVRMLADNNDLDWIIITALPEWAFMGEIDANNRTTVIITIFALILNIFVGLLVAQWLLRPVEKLNQAAQSIEEGEFADELLTHLTHRRDEMGQMARVFQRMGSTIIAREHDLKERCNHLEEETAKAQQAVAAARIGQGSNYQTIIARARQLRSSNGSTYLDNFTQIATADLKQISYLADLAQPQLERLLTLATPQLFKEGQYICQENEQGQEFFIIISGQVEILVQGKAVATLSTGDYFGEVALFLNTSRMASVRAITDTKLLTMNRSGLHQLLQDCPELSDRIFTSLSNRRAEIMRRQTLLQTAGVDTAKSGGYGSWLQQKLQGLGKKNRGHS